MKPAVHCIWWFGPFRLSAAERLLRRGETPVPLPPKAVDTLVALLAAPGEVIEKRALIEQVWPDTFVEEGGLARNVSLLRKTLGTDKAGSEYIETIPRRGYRFVAPVRTAPEDAPEPAGLAVLPLRSLSPEPADDSFADGLTDALIGSLLRLGGPRVVSRTSVMRLKGSPLSLRELAGQLAVEFVVEGAVLLAGGRVRIGVTLLRGRDETQIWSGEYERELRDILALQSEIVGEITARIRERLPMQEPPPRLEPPVLLRPVHPEAYQHYLRGRALWNQRTRESLSAALACFRQAIALDPEDAASYAGLAASYALLGSVGYDGMPPHAAMPAAREAALEALRLQSRLADAHAALGIVKLLYDWDLSGAEDSLRAALRYDAACLAAHQWQGELHLARAEPEQAGAAFTRGLALDPESTPCSLGTGWSYYFARRYPEAIAQFAHTLQCTPRLPMALYGKGLAHHHNREPEQAFAALRRAEAASGGEPASVALLAITAVLTGNAAAAEERRLQLLQMAAETYVPPIYLAFLHAMRNELDEAFSWLDRAYDERSSYLVFLRVQPALHNLRADPRFFKLLHRVGRR